MGLKRFVVLESRVLTMRGGFEKVCRVRSLVLRRRRGEVWS